MMNQKKSSRNYCRQFLFIILHSAFIIFLASCSVSKEISRSAKENVLTNKALQTAHVGISIYDPATNRYLYNYQGDKYFVPASNTKLPTCYAAMKYLGDSLVGGRVVKFNDDIIVFPSGDPTFLHHDFNKQPLFNFLKENGKKVVIKFKSWQSQKFGNGWSWNDYTEPYMVERSAFPMYNNLVTFYNIDASGTAAFGNTDYLKIDCFPKRFSDNMYWYVGRFKFYETDKISQVAKERFLKKQEVKLGFTVGREYSENNFYLKVTSDVSSTQRMPFVTSQTTINTLLWDTLGKEVLNENKYFTGDEKISNIRIIIHSQPTDSVLKPMMHRSDNFFAEQMLLMVSNEMLGVMNDEKIIDTLLKTDFKDLPQKPRWVDGSGLSRYNLFTAQDFVAILNKMKNEFGMDRIKEILPTGGEGTISSYYKADSGYIYGKTGTLSGVVAFSGFLYTKKGKLLIFSTLVNNHQASATEVRRAVEKFLQGIRNKY